MAPDLSGKAWQQLAKDLAARLPGSWRVAGSGIKTVVAREPIGWVLVWFGANRVRRDDEPCLIGGDATLVGPPYSLAVGHGLRSDTRRHAPKRIDPQAPDAAGLVESFVVDDLLPRVDPWTESRLAEEAEAELALPAEQREGQLRFQDAAGWRVLDGGADPEDPARQAVEWYGQAHAPELETWYRTFLDTWHDGGRDATRSYLEQQRAEALARLKLA